MTGHHFPIRIYYEDTDFSGNVYHAAYLKFFERGRTEFLREEGIHHSELAEQGIANVNMSQWYALFAPAKTPTAVIDRLNRELNGVLADKAVQKKIEDQGAEVEPGTPEQLKTLVQKEVLRWKGVVSAAKIKAE